MKESAAFKFIAGVLVFFFVLNDIGQAAPALDLSASFRSETPHAAHIHIPPELATLDDWYESRTPGDARFMLHIQDAHAQPEAQARTRELITYLNKQYGFKTVFVEGAAEPLDTKWLPYAQVPEARKQWIEEKTKLGELSGTDLAVLGNIPGLQALPIETIEGYRNGYQKLLAVFDSQGEVKSFFDFLDSKYGLVASRILDDKTRSILSEWKKFESGQRDFLPFVKNISVLAKQDLDIDFDALYTQIDWPQITRLLVLQRMEESFKEKSAAWGGVTFKKQGELEKQVIIDSLKQKKADAGLIQGLERLDERYLNLNRITVGDGGRFSSPRALIEKLVAASNQHQVDLRQYSAFLRYAGYLILRGELKSSDLFNELEVLFERLLEKQTAGQGQNAKELLVIFKDVELLRKLLSLELSRHEWKQALDRRALLDPQVILTRLKNIDQQENSNQEGGNGPLKDVFSWAFDFYDAAIAREQISFEKISAELAINDKAILVTGGFHTEGINEFFREKSISYGTLTPRITKLESSDLYRQAMRAASRSTQALVTPLQNPKVQREMTAGGAPDLSAPPYRWFANLNPFGDDGKIRELRASDRAGEWLEFLKAERFDFSLYQEVGSLSVYIRGSDESLEKLDRFIAESGKNRQSNMQIHRDSVTDKRNDAAKITRIGSFALNQAAVMYLAQTYGWTAGNWQSGLVQLLKSNTENRQWITFRDEKKDMEDFIKELKLLKNSAGVTQLPDLLKRFDVKNNKSGLDVDRLRLIEMVAGEASPDFKATFSEVYDARSFIYYLITEQHGTLLNQIASFVERDEVTEENLQVYFNTIVQAAQYVRRFMQAGIIGEDDHLVVSLADPELGQALASFIPAPVPKELGTVDFINQMKSDLEVLSAQQDKLDEVAVESILAWVGELQKINTHAPDVSQLLELLNEFGEYVLDQIDVSRTRVYEQARKTLEASMREDELLRSQLDRFASGAFQTPVDLLIHLLLHGHSHQLRWFLKRTAEESKELAALFFDGITLIAESRSFFQKRGIDSDELILLLGFEANPFPDGDAGIRAILERFDSKLRTLPAEKDAGLLTLKIQSWLARQSALRSEAREQNDTGRALKNRRQFLGIFTAGIMGVMPIFSGTIRGAGKENSLLDSTEIAQVYRDTALGLVHLRKNHMPINQTPAPEVPVSGAWMKSADIGFMLIADLLMMLNYEKNPVAEIAEPQAVQKRILDSLMVMKDLTDQFELKIDGRGTGILPEVLVHHDGLAGAQVGDQFKYDRPQEIHGQEGKKGIAYAFYDMGLTHERLKIIRDVFAGGIIEGVRNDEISRIAAEILDRADYRPFIDQEGRIHAQLFVTGEGEHELGSLIVDNQHTEARFVLSIAELLGDPALPEDQRYGQGLSVWQKMNFRWDGVDQNGHFWPIAEGDYALSLWSELSGAQFYNPSEVAPKSWGTSIRNYWAVLTSRKAEFELPFVSATGLGTAPDPDHFGEYGIAGETPLPEVIVPAYQFATVMMASEGFDNLRQFIRTSGPAAYHAGWGFVDAVNPRGQPFTGNSKILYINQGLTLEFLNYQLLREIVAQTAWGRRAAGQFKVLDEESPAPEITQTKEWFEKYRAIVSQAFKLQAGVLDDMADLIHDYAERELDTPLYSGTAEGIAIHFLPKIFYPIQVPEEFKKFEAEKARPYKDWVDSIRKAVKAQSRGMNRWEKEYLRIFRDARGSVPDVLNRMVKLIQSYASESLGKQITPQDARALAPHYLPALNQGAEGAFFHQGKSPRPWSDLSAEINNKATARSELRVRGAVSFPIVLGLLGALTAGVYVSMLASALAGFAAAALFFLPIYAGARFFWRKVLEDKKFPFKNIQSAFLWEWKLLARVLAKNVSVIINISRRNRIMEQDDLKSETRLRRMSLAELEAEVRNRLQEYLNVLQVSGDDQTVVPDVFLLLGNPDLEVFLKFADQWKALSAAGKKVPIIISGGVGRGTNLILESIIHHYKMPDVDALKALTGVRETDGALAEARALKWVLEREGIDGHLIQIEEFSTRTIENLQYSEPLITQVVSGQKIQDRKANIAIVTFPALRLRGIANALNWIGNSFDWINHEIYRVSAAAWDSETLLYWAGSLAGHPVEMVEKFNRHDDPAHPEKITGRINAVSEDQKIAEFEVGFDQGFMRQLYESRTALQEVFFAWLKRLENPLPTDIHSPVVLEPDYDLRSLKMVRSETRTVEDIARATDNIRASRAFTDDDGVFWQPILLDSQLNIAGNKPVRFLNQRGELGQIISVLHPSEKTQLESITVQFDAPLREGRIRKEQTFNIGDRSNAAIYFSDEVNAGEKAVTIGGQDVEQILKSRSESREIGSINPEDIAFFRNRNEEEHRIQKDRLPRVAEGLKKQLGEDGFAMWVGSPKVRMVSISNLKREMQNYLNPYKLEVELVKAKVRKEYGEGTPPIVVIKFKSRSDMWVIDGHHRAVAVNEAWGEDAKISAYIYEIEDSLNFLEEDSRLKAFYNFYYTKLQHTDAELNAGVRGNYKMNQEGSDGEYFLVNMMWNGSLPGIEQYVLSGIQGLESTAALDFLEVAIIEYEKRKSIINKLRVIQGIAVLPAIDPVLLPDPIIVSEDIFQEIAKNYSDYQTKPNSIVFPSGVTIQRAKRSEMRAKLSFEQKKILDELGLEWDIKNQQIKRGKNFKPLVLQSKLVYVRHGETKLIALAHADGEPRLQGDVDEPLNQLNETGIHQSENLVPILKPLIQDELTAGKVLFFTSPLSRAQDTAQPSAKAFGVKIQPPREGLREIAFGDYEALTVDELEKQFGREAVRLTKAYREHNAAVVFPNGESFIHVLSRARQELVDLDKELTEQGKTGVLFAHGTLGAVFQILLGEPQFFDDQVLLGWRNYLPKTGEPFILNPARSEARGKRSAAKPATMKQLEGFIEYLEGALVVLGKIQAPELRAVGTKLPSAIIFAGYLFLHPRFGLNLERVMNAVTAYLEYRNPKITFLNPPKISLALKRDMAVVDDALVFSGVSNDWVATVSGFHYLENFVRPFYEGLPPIERRRSEMREVVVTQDHLHLVKEIIGTDKLVRKTADEKIYIFSEKEIDALFSDEGWGEDKIKVDSSLYAGKRVLTLAIGNLPFVLSEKSEFVDAIDLDPATIAIQTLKQKWRYHPEIDGWFKNQPPRTMDNALEFVRRLYQLEVESREESVEEKKHKPEYGATNINFKSMDLLTPSELEGEPYDLVVMPNIFGHSNGFTYRSEFDQFLNNMSRWLSPHGKIIIVPLVTQGLDWFVEDAQEPFNAVGGWVSDLKRSGYDVEWSQEFRIPSFFSFIDERAEFKGQYVIISKARSEMRNVWEGQEHLTNQLTEFDLPQDFTFTVSRSDEWSVGAIFLIDPLDAPNASALSVGPWGWRMMINPQGVPGVFRLGMEWTPGTGLQFETNEAGDEGYRMTTIPELTGQNLLLDWSYDSDSRTVTFVFDEKLKQLLPEDFSFAIPGAEIPSDWLKWQIQFQSRSEMRAIDIDELRVLQVGRQLKQSDYHLSAAEVGAQYGGETNQDYVSVIKETIARAVRRPVDFDSANLINVVVSNNPDRVYKRGQGIAAVEVEQEGYQINFYIHEAFFEVLEVRESADRIRLIQALVLRQLGQLNGGPGSIDLINFLDEVSKLHNLASETALDIAQRIGDRDGIVSLDGMTGAGKTTFSHMLKRRIVLFGNYDADVFSLDMFLLDKETREAINRSALGMDLTEAQRDLLERLAADGSLPGFKIGQPWMGNEHIFRNSEQVEFVSSLRNYLEREDSNTDFDIPLRSAYDQNTAVTVADEKITIKKKSSEGKRRIFIVESLYANREELQSAYDYRLRLQIGHEISRSRYYSRSIARDGRISEVSRRKYDEFIAPSFAAYEARTANSIDRVIDYEDFKLLDKPGESASDGITSVAELGAEDVHYPKLRGSKRVDDGAGRPGNFYKNLQAGRGPPSRVAIATARRAFSNPQPLRDQILRFLRISEPATEDFKNRPTIYVFPTKLCPVGCSFCYFSSDMKGKRTRENAFDDEGVERFIRFTEDANPASIVVSGGGDPFVELEKLLRMIAGAKAHRIDLVTSGFWGRDYGKAQQIVEKVFAAAQKNPHKPQIRLRLSIDEYHRVKAPLEIHANMLQIFSEPKNMNRYADGKFTVMFHSVRKDKALTDLEDILAKQSGIRVTSRGNIDDVSSEMTLSNGLIIPVRRVDVYNSNTEIDLNDLNDAAVRKNFAAYTAKNSYKATRPDGRVMMGMQRNVLGQDALDFLLSYDGLMEVWASSMPDHKSSLYDETYADFRHKALSDVITLAFLEKGMQYIRDIAYEVNPIAFDRALAVNIPDWFARIAFEEAKTRLYVTIRILQDYLAEGRVEKSEYDGWPENVKELVSLTESELAHFYEESDFNIVYQYLDSRDTTPKALIDLYQRIKLNHYDVTPEVAREIILASNKISVAAKLEFLQGAAQSYNMTPEAVPLYVHAFDLSAEALNQSATDALARQVHDASAAALIQLAEQYGRSDLLRFIAGHPFDYGHATEAMDKVVALSKNKGNAPMPTAAHLFETHPEPQLALVGSPASIFDFLIARDKPASEINLAELNLKTRLSFDTLERDMRVLRRAGLVERENRFGVVIFWIKPEILKDADRLQRVKSILDEEYTAGKITENSSPENRDRIVAKITEILLTADGRSEMRGAKNEIAATSDEVLVAAPELSLSFEKAYEALIGQIDSLNPSDAAVVIAQFFTDRELSAERIMVVLADLTSRLGWDKAFGMVRKLQAEHSALFARFQGEALVLDEISVEELRDKEFFSQTVEAIVLALMVNPKMQFRFVTPGDRDAAEKYEEMLHEVDRHLQGLVNVREQVLYQAGAIEDVKRFIKLTVRSSLPSAISLSKELAKLVPQTEHKKHVLRTYTKESRSMGLTAAGLLALDASGQITDFFRDGVQFTISEERLGLFNLRSEIRRMFETVKAYATAA